MRADDVTYSSGLVPSSLGPPPTLPWASALIEAIIVTRRLSTNQHSPALAAWQREPFRRCLAYLPAGAQFLSNSTRRLSCAGATYGQSAKMSEHHMSQQDKDRIAKSLFNKVSRAASDCAVRGGTSRRPCRQCPTVSNVLPAANTDDS